LLADLRTLLLANFGALARFGALLSGIVTGLGLLGAPFLAFLTGLGPIVVMGPRRERGGRGCGRQKYGKD
jgi:hypothetical protein